MIRSRLPGAVRPNGHQLATRGRHLLGSVGLVLLATGGVGLPPAALGAAPNDEFVSTLSEITVQAQRRSENAQEVPIVINTLSSAELNSVGVTSAASLAVAVPGLVVVSAQGGVFQPRLRGVGTTMFGPGIENPVALFIDNVYYSSQLMAPSDLSDVDQVSVLKGPQGTLFGRNSTGGVLQLSTRAPTAEPSAEVRTEFDNYRTSRNFLYLTGAVADHLNTNLSVKYTSQGNGWGRNLANGDDIFKIKSDISLRNRWDWTPTDQTSVKLSLDYGRRSDNMGPNFYIAAVPGFSGFFPGIGVDRTSSNPYDTTNWATNFNKLRQTGGSLEISQGLGGPHLVSITAYRSFKFDNFTDSNASLNPESGVETHDRGHQFSQELQLVSPDSGKFRWMVGAYYFRANETYDPMNLTYYDFFSEIFYEAPPTSTALETFNPKLTTESYAVLGQGTLEIADGTHLTLGARYTEEKRTISGPVRNFVDGVPFPFFDVDLNGKYKESKPTWRVALDHQFNQDLMAYVSLNRGFKSGGFNAITASEASYKAETVDTLEAGMKSELLGQRLRLNSALFYSKYKNMQVMLVEGCCLVAINAGKSTIYGLDFDAEWHANDKLIFVGGFEYLHTRFDDFPNMPVSVPFPGGGIESEVLANGAGNQVPLAPHFTGDLSINYRVALQTSHLDFNVTDLFNSGYYWEVDNVAKQSAYNVVNASVTWTGLDERLSIGLFGRNLGNKVVPSTLAATAPSSFQAVNGNPPRVYGVNFNYKFGGVH